MLAVDGGTIMVAVVVAAVASAWPLAAAVDCEEVGIPLPLEPFGSTWEVDAYWVAWLQLLVADLAAVAAVYAHY